MWANNELVNGVIRDFCETDSLADKPPFPPLSQSARHVYYNITVGAEISEQATLSLTAL
jgi:hypothetical protein